MFAASSPRRSHRRRRQRRRRRRRSTVGRRLGFGSTPPSIWTRAAVLLAAWPSAAGKQYSKTYSFWADQGECDGQCSYCRHAHNHHHWAAVRSKLSKYVYTPGEERKQQSIDNNVLQELINYSWDKDVRYECIIGIISMRLLSFMYIDPMQFFDTNKISVLDFLDVFNMHTGALDLLTSAWASILAGGWPVFKQLHEVSRKLKARLADDGAYPELQDRANECDIFNTEDDLRYLEEVRRALKTGEWPLVGVSLVALQSGMGCPAGVAVALLAVAFDLVQKRSMYQGSLKDPDNLVYTVISTAQDAVTNWVKSKSNWAPFFDLLTTEWPLWEMLSELACVNTERNCATRSSWQCYDMVARKEVPCPHMTPTRKLTFASCGEHDICTTDPGLDPAVWCVPFERRPPTPREPWLLNLGHDDEHRVCAQCGQDGILRTIFEHVGFRVSAGPAAVGGNAPFFVEFGARKPGMLNSAALREVCHWDGLLLDSQPGETPHGGCKSCPGVAELVRQEMVTAENVVGLFKRYDVPRDFDLLTIDTDYNDYWIWRALLADGYFRPRVVAVDFNPDIPLHEAKVVEYSADAEWDGSVYTVGSLLAYALMAKAHGYAFAYALEMGSHAFFIRGDLLADSDRELPLRMAKKQSHPPDVKARQFVDVLYDFVPAGIGSGMGGDTGNDTATGAKDDVETLRRRVENLMAEVQQLRRISAVGKDMYDPAPSPPVARPDGPVISPATEFYSDVRARSSI